MKSYLFMCILLANFDQNAFAAPPTKNEDESKPIFIGEWKIVYQDEKGVISTDIASNDRLTFTRDKAVFNRFGKESSVPYSYINDKGIIKIDFSLAAEEKNYAIMRIVDSKLELMVSRSFRPNSTNERPIEFSTKRDKNNNLNGLILQKYERVVK